MDAYQVQGDPPPVYMPPPNPSEQQVTTHHESAQETHLSVRRSNRPKNCPPFIPCCYFSIKTEVPPKEQWKMYALIALLIYLWVVYVINLVVASIAAAITSEDSYSGISPENLSTLTAAIIYFVLFVPGSLLCWFLPAYCAHSGRNSRVRTIAIIWFFVVMMFQILGFAVNAIGLPNFGACGLFNGVRFFNKNSDGSGPGQASLATAALFLICAFLWILGLPLAVLLLIMKCIYFVCGAGRTRLKKESDRMEDEEVIVQTTNQY